LKARRRPAAVRKKNAKKNNNSPFSLLPPAHLPIMTSWRRRAFSSSDSEASLLMAMMARSFWRMASAAGSGLGDSAAEGSSAGGGAAVAGDAIWMRALVGDESGGRVNSEAGVREGELGERERAFQNSLFCSPSANKTQKTGLPLGRPRV
jgi:hypothetical protein